jgi:hypothetical protein
VIGIAVAAIGAACMALSGPWRNVLIAPGHLSRRHAQLIEGQNTTPRCAQCHAAGEKSVAGWWHQSFGSESQGAAQSTLCMTCHERTVAPSFAMAAHGVEIESLNDTGTERASGAVNWEDRQRDPREPIACSACHREHQGLDHNLRAMSSRACQACHREQYDSFAGEHPDFGQWPYERRTRIAFDHAAHQMKHFPAEQQDFACAACHQADATGERQLTASYATSCAQCHDKALVTSVADGLPLLSLPTLDVEALAAAGHEVAAWPADVTGDFDGVPPMPAVLLIAADPLARQALSVLGPPFDFYDIDPEDATQIAAAAEIARAMKSLTDDLADRGQVATDERLSTLLGRELREEELEALASRLSPDVVERFRAQSFGNAAATNASTDDRALLLDRVPAGGWIYDALAMSLRYKPVGHADPWLRAWLDVLAEAASGPHAEFAEPLLRAALKPTAPGQCGSCHSIERDANERLVIQWHPFNAAQAPNRFTRFDHGPHTMQPLTGDCTTCHHIAPAKQAATVYTGDDPHRFVTGFESMTKASCATCHTAWAAGDSCMQCHTYHQGRQ